VYVCVCVCVPRILSHALVLQHYHAVQQRQHEATVQLVSLMLDVRDYLESTPEHLHSTTITHTLKNKQRKKKKKRKSFNVMAGPNSGVVSSAAEMLSLTELLEKLQILSHKDCDCEECAAQRRVMKMRSTTREWSSSEDDDSDDALSLLDGVFHEKRRNKRNKNKDDNKMSKKKSKDYEQATLFLNRKSRNKQMKKLKKREKTRIQRIKKDYYLGTTDHKKDKKKPKRDPKHTHTHTHTSTPKLSANKRGADIKITVQSENKSTNTKGAAVNSFPFWSLGDISQLCQRIESVQLLRIRSNRVCRLCAERAPDIVLVPCGHNFLCRQCAAQYDKSIDHFDCWECGARATELVTSY